MVCHLARVCLVRACVGVLVYMLVCVAVLACRCAVIGFDKLTTRRAALQVLIEIGLLWNCIIPTPIPKRQISQTTIDNRNINAQAHNPFACEHT